MKPSELLREAAQVMEWRDRREGCCDALMLADKMFKPSEETLIAAIGYLELFRPGAKKVWWFGALTPANEKVRILCLLSAADIAEGEGQ